MMIDVVKKPTMGVMKFQMCVMKDDMVKIGKIMR